MSFNFYSNFYQVTGVMSRITFESMKELIGKNIADFIKMNPEATVRLCDQWFHRNHMIVAKELTEHSDLELKFLATVLQIHEPDIVAEHENCNNYN
jgi:hypothetical protein